MDTITLQRQPGGHWKVHGVRYLSQEDRRGALESFQGAIRAFQRGLVVSNCQYCGKEIDGLLSRKYCSASHRVMACRRNKARSLLTA